MTDKTNAPEELNYITKSINENLRILIKSTNVRKTAIVEIRGDLNLYNAPLAKNFLLSNVMIQEAHLAFDISQVESIDSSGIGMLISFQNDLKRNNGKMVLWNLSETVKRGMKITKLDKFFTICDDQINAIDTLY